MKKFAKLLTIATLAAFGVSANAASIQDAQGTINDDTAALNELMSNPQSSIPTDLLHAATCVANIHMIKAGVIWGGNGGRGVVSCRDTSGAWSDPLFIAIGSASWGLQLGIAEVDLTLVFTDPNAAASFLKGNVTLNADGGLAVGPQGRDLTAGTNYSLQNKIYSYSRSKGLYIGITLEGSVLGPQESFNQVVYGDRSNQDILMNPTHAVEPSLVTPYTDALTNYTR